MREITDTREIQEIELSILERVHNFCIANDITYSLAYGTMIGAARHKGFIPWDDDIDIIMPRPYFEKFFKIFKVEGLELHCLRNDKRHDAPVAKVYDTRTAIMQPGSSTMDYGLYMDIYVFDSFQSEAKIKSFFKLRKLLIFLMMCNKEPLYRKGRALYRNLLRIALYPFFAFFSTRRVSLFIEWYLKRLNYEFGSFLTDMTPYTNICQCLPKSVFESTVDVEFEGKKFKAMNGWRKQLKGYYGDYMQLPPPEQRVSNHDFRAWWR